MARILYWNVNNFSNEKIARMIGWHSEISIEDGIARLIRWRKGEKSRS